MTITVNTAAFIGLLTDALHTADKSGDLGLGIHMATHRDGYGDEPGQTDLLAATSTDRYVVGHGFMPVDGQMLTSVWPVDSTRTVIHVCAALVSTFGKDHTVDVEVVEMVAPRADQDGQDTHPGFMVTLRETPALFDSETEFAFQAKSEQSFPTRTVWRSLSGRATDKRYRDLPALGWAPRVLAAVTAVAKRHKEPMWWYRTPGGFAHRVQIGDSWLGVALPVVPTAGERDSAEPTIDPLFAHPADDTGEGEVIDGEVVEDELAYPEVEAPAPLALPPGRSDGPSIGPEFSDGGSK